jgi:hypothetical protein
MFGNALSCHAEMPAKLIQSLAVVEMELVEEGASAWVGQSFKDIVHWEVFMQPNGCIFIQPSQRCLYLVREPGPVDALARSVFQIKRAGPEVDDPVMAPKNLGPEQSRDGLGTSEQIAMNETLEIDHANILTNDIHRADG